jgi:hypothetical protein
MLAWVHVPVNLEEILSTKKPYISESNTLLLYCLLPDDWHGKEDACCLTADQTEHSLSES